MDMAQLGKVLVKPERRRQRVGFLTSRIQNQVCFHAKEREMTVPKAAFDTTASVFQPAPTESGMFKESLDVDIVEPKYAKNLSGSDNEGFRFDESSWTPAPLCGDTSVPVDG